MEQHIQPLISDYVLGLLPDSDRHRLESHVSLCAACRQAVVREQQLELLVRQTVQLATQPLPARLQALRPAAPRSRTQTPAARLARQLAPVMLLIVLLAGVALQATRLGNELGFDAGGFYRVSTPTATSTSTPTATIAGLSEPPTVEAGDSTSALVPTGQATTIAPAAQPDQALPAPTPIAALPAAGAN